MIIAKSYEFPIDGFWKSPYHLRNVTMNVDHWPAKGGCHVFQIKGSDRSCGFGRSFIHFIGSQTKDNVVTKSDMITGRNHEAK